MDFSVRSQTKCSWKLLNSFCCCYLIIESHHQLRLMCIVIEATMMPPPPCFTSELCIGSWLEFYFIHTLAFPSQICCMASLSFLTGGLWCLHVCPVDVTDCSFLCLPSNLSHLSSVAVVFLGRPVQRLLFSTLVVSSKLLCWLCPMFLTDFSLFSRHQTGFLFFHR